MGLLALVCLVVVLIIVPNEIIYGIFYLAFLALVCFVGFWAAVMWLASSA